MLERDVAEGVHRVAYAFVNWYLIEDAGAVTIVDTGLPRSWKALPSALAELGRAPGDVAAVVCTHAHADHLGFAERVRRDWHVPVWLHERDRTLSRHPLNYEKEHSPLRHVNAYTARVLVAWLHAGVLSTKPLGEVRAFADEERLDVPGRPQPVFTPGHTHGHTGYWLADRDVLLCGDALATVEPYSGRSGAHLPSGASNVDSAQALASLQRVADTGAGVLLPGHGPPWTRGAQAAVDEARERGPS